MGLLKPTHGQAHVDGIPVFNNGEYLTNIAGVMQDDQLLAGSIADNIACFESNIDMQKVIASASLASIHEDILQMPMQYNTLVGDMGSALSGGQQQRIVLARACYREPSIIFMDEATSHLDMNTEKKVNEAVAQLKITRVVGAHRPETIKNADRVYDLSLMCMSHNQA